MATAAQITANRANAQLCTGPKTAEGKERSSQNALRHGLTSSRVVLAHEDRAAFDAMLTGLTESWRPDGLQEEILVREIAENYWRLQRARRFEDELLASRGNSDLELAEWLVSPDGVQFQRIGQYAGRIERAWQRAMRDLERQQSARRRERQRTNLEAAADARRQAADASRQAADARRRSEELLQEVLMPSTSAFPGQLGFVSHPEPHIPEPVEVFHTELMEKSTN